jgi:hypothetical protein
VTQQTQSLTSPEPERTQDVVRILGLEDGERTDRSLKRMGDWRVGRSEVPVDVFRQRVTEFLDSMRHTISVLPSVCGDYELNEVTVSAEVSAKGQVSLLGSGGELAGKAGLTFTFTRKPADCT